ncbi:tetratricopeptide repeat protein [Fibrella sp. HMF5335]|uniref:Tetratricopeptide repeat protein n=1 Tax=Fibrella rubiginis TaxID=2817060 RepID=A0A939GFY9_9BACT|nr:tetratricopeptide repeat protein [Fibrella rubiginis]MBO0938442.1 tetratricopeptide repeat protein [Fibrella rubiginis]
MCPLTMRRFFTAYLLYFLLSCTSSSDYLEQGRKLLREGKSREAVQVLNQAVEADADNAEALNTRGVAYFELKEYNNALLDYEQALKITPDFYSPYYNRALLKTTQGDVQGALKDYSEAIRLAPDTAKLATSEAFLNRGQLFAAQDQIQPALTDFDQSIKLNPRNALALYNRGNLRFNEKNLDGAIADFQACIAVDPNFGKAFYGLGLSQVLANQREAACLSLKQAQKLNYPDAANAIAAYCQ